MSLTSCSYGLGQGQVHSLRQLFDYSDDGKHKVKENVLWVRWMFWRSPGLSSASTPKRLPTLGQSQGTPTYLGFPPGLNMHLFFHVSSQPILFTPSKALLRTIELLCCHKLSNSDCCPQKSVGFSSKDLILFIRIGTFPRVSEQTSLVHFTDELCEAQGC